MSRKYKGDIEGSFLSGVQSSYAADRFGVSGQEPGYIEYYYDIDDLEGVEEEINLIEGNLGSMTQTIETFFKMNNNRYDDKMLEEAGISTKELKEYADLCLGKKIRDCIIENKGCEFVAYI
jgi:hypothetical protein